MLLPKAGLGKKAEFCNVCKIFKNLKISLRISDNLRFEIETYFKPLLYVAGVYERIIADFSATSVLLISSSSWKFTFSTYFAESKILANKISVSYLNWVWFRMLTQLQKPKCSHAYEFGSVSENDQF